jgi:hypothetical protein
MGPVRNLSENDVERLLAGHAPGADDPRLEEIAGFVRALVAAVPEPAAAPDPALIARLADAAAAGGSAAAAPRRGRARGRLRSRTRLIGRAAIAAATVPALFAALAFAGVTLPVPADDAFEELGLELPNQATDDDADDAVAPGNKAAANKKGSNGKGEATRRSNRKAYGPSRAARQNPPGNAVRRGPNPTPGTPPGKPESTPSGSSDADGNGAAGKAFGQANKNAAGIK